jgi:hypothetical protein
MLNHIQEKKKENYGSIQFKGIENQKIIKIPEFTTVDKYVFSTINDFEELEEFYRLTYSTYVEEFNYIEEDKLEEKQKKRKMNWDSYDSSRNTSHVMIYDNTKLVGGFRFIDYDIPLENSMILNDNEKIKIPFKREVSKLSLKKMYRSPKLLDAIFSYVYQINLDLGVVYWSSFNQKNLIKIYEAYGAQNIGEFVNPNYPETPSIGYLWNINDLKNKTQNDGKVNPTLIDRIINKPSIFQRVS